MKPARAPQPRADRGVEIVWHPENDSRRLRRVAEILADILDNATTPGERRKP